jgi:hypothetical protein
MSPSSRTRRLYGFEFDVSRARRLLLLVGFLAVAGGIQIAHASPARGYELSLYRATPPSVWLLLAVGALFSLTVMAYSVDGWEWPLAAMLAGLVVLTVVGLPLIRGYHFYGLADALNHLGFARKIASGHRAFWSYIYPGSHTFAVFTDRFTGWGLPRSMLFVVLAFVGIFLTFVPLTVTKIVSNVRAVQFSVVCALFLMPINNIATTLQFHAFSLATLFAPVVFYVMMSHLAGDADDAAIPFGLSAVSLLMPALGLTMTLFHPLAMFDVLAILTATALLQQVVRRWRPANPLGRTKNIYGQPAVLAGIWLFWSSDHFAFERTTQKSIETFRDILQGTSSTAPGVQQRAESARSIGVSLWELFVKLQLVEFLCLLVVVALVLWHWSGRAAGTDVERERKTVITYFAFGGLSLVPVVIIQLHGNVSHLFFRHLGFAFVVVSILFAVGVDQFRRGLGVDWAALRPLLVVGAVLLVVASAVTFYGSPFIYRFNQQTPEGHMQGYETAFEQQPQGAEVWFGPFRPFGRYKNSLAAKPDTSWYPGIVFPPPRATGTPPPEALETDVVQYYETHPEPVVRRDHYLPVSDVVVAHETELYGGERYSAAAFESLSRQENVHRIRANGVMTTYYVDLETPEAGLGATDRDAAGDVRAPSRVRAAATGGR